jgi:hypothetical protein
VFSFRLNLKSNNTAPIRSTIRFGTGNCGLGVFYAIIFARLLKHLVFSLRIRTQGKEGVVHRILQTPRIAVKTAQFVAPQAS